MTADDPIPGPVGRFAEFGPARSEPSSMMLDSRGEREARGEGALERLIEIAYRDHGGAVRVRNFLLGLYNGQTFKFDLTELRSLDRETQEDVLAVLAMDIDGPSVEIHCRPGAEIIAQWAADAWPQED